MICYAVMNRSLGWYVGCNGRYVSHGRTYITTSRRHAVRAMHQAACNYIGDSFEIIEHPVSFVNE